MLVLGTIGSAGNALNYVGRIPLVDSEDRPSTVILPFAAQALGLDARLVEKGSRSWRPVDLVQFLQNPDGYLKPR